MKCSRLLHTTLLTLCISKIAATPPSDQLLPPPPTTNLHGPPPQFIRQPVPEPPGIMSRIARWFGFEDSNNREQQVQASYFQPQYKEAPPYANYRHTRQKLPCNPCNKDPWIPMFPGNLQYPILKGDYPTQPQVKFNYHPNNNNFDSPSQFVNLPTYRPQPFPPGNKYASAYNFLQGKPPNFNPHLPVHAHLRNLPHRISPGPIPVPNLSQLPIPPIYDAAPFYGIATSGIPLGHSPSVTPVPPQHQLHPVQIPSSLVAGSPDASIEIIKSVPLTDFVASIEYPPDVIQSPIVDISYNPSPVSSTSIPPRGSTLFTKDVGFISSTVAPFDNHLPPSPSHATEFYGGFSPTSISPTSIVPPNSPVDNHLSDEIPKLTELGSYSPIVAPTIPPSYIASPLQHLEPDSHPAASTHNISYRNENKKDVGNYVNHYYDTTGATESNLIQTEPPTTIPSIVPFEPQTEKRNRETPKHLLDSPIYYSTGSSPRPFTRDPGDLRVRSSTFDHPNTLWQTSSTATPWAFVPTPTSTFSSLEASGVYAGISPPSLYQSSPQPFEYRSNHQPKRLHQIVIPYTVGKKPAPFKPRDDETNDLTGDGRYSDWANAHDIEVHEQQESKLVTATEAPTSKTTKYLTKILASNIRELLRREHEFKNKSSTGLDIVKLQKNIDDWTEQEFTSLTGRGSTVSLRGRSKNIPSEYLTTTPSLTRKQTESLVAESTQPTTIYANLLGDDELKKFDSLAKLVDDNRIELSDSVSSTTGTPTASPLYIRTVPPTQTPRDLWNQLRVSISPLTKEKVYVVTPANHKDAAPDDNVGNFKSPRFLVRPTPGTSSSAYKSNSKVYTPELFGLMAISAYSPLDQIEAEDDNTKAISIIQPSNPNIKRSTETDSVTSTTNLNSTTAPASH